MRRICRIVYGICAISVACLTSCVKQTQDLDLNKDIKLDMQLAQSGLSLPVGNLSKIYLDSLIQVDADDPDALIKKLDGSLYGISMSDSVDRITIDVDEISFEIDNPDIDPIEISFEDPTPDNVVLDRTEEVFSIDIDEIDLQTINESLPMFSKSQNNNPIEVEGLPEILEVPFTKSVNIKGYSITIDTVFEVQTPNITPQGTFEDFELPIKFDYVANVMGTSYPIHIDTAITVDGSDYELPRVGFEVEIPETTVEFDFEYDQFPTDVETINTIYFADDKNMNSENGQLIEFDVNLKQVDALFIDPYYNVKSLTVEFPEEIVLEKDPLYELDHYVTIENGHIFKLEMPASDSLFVNKIGTLVDPNNPTNLPLSFYVKQMNLNRGVDQGSTSTMTYTGEIKYNMTFVVKGQPYLIGKESLDMTMGLEEKLALKDLTVTTKTKQIELDDNVVAIDAEVDGLEDISKINDITFIEDESFIKLQISALDLDPFSFDESLGGFYVQLPDMFEFAGGCVDEQGNLIANIDESNRFVLNPSKIIGNTIMLKPKRINIADKSIVDGKITIDDQVNYGGEIYIGKVENVGLSDVEKLSSQDVTIAMWGELVIDNANVVTDVITSEMQDSTVISIDEEIDDMLLMVKNIELENSASIEVAMQFDGVPTTIDNILLDNFVLEFPSFIELAYTGDDDRIKLLSNGVQLNGNLTKDELSSNGKGFVIDGIEVKGFDFANPLYTQKVDGKNRLVLKDQQVKFSGSVKVVNQEISSSELQDITITPTVNIGRVVVKSFTGKVFPEIEPVNEAIALDLGEDLSFLQSDNNRLSLAAPQITINFTTNFSIPIDLDIVLNSKKNDGSSIGEDIRPDRGIVRIPACGRDEEQRTTTIIFQKNEDKESVTGDSIYVQISRLSELLTTIPDSVIFSLVAKADTSMTNPADYHYADLQRELAVDANFDVTVPLTFDELYLEYTDTVSGLQEDLFADLADITKQVGLKLSANIESTVPLGLNVTAIPLDIEGNVMQKGVTISTVQVAPGSEGTPSKSLFELDVDIEEEAISLIDALVIKAECVSMENETSELRSTQYLHITDAVIQIPDGIVLDFTDNDK